MSDDTLNTLLNLFPHDDNVQPAVDTFPNTATEVIIISAADAIKYFHNAVLLPQIIIISPSPETADVVQLHEQ
jgi:hypothetical protein